MENKSSTQQLNSDVKFTVRLILEQANHVVALRRRKKLGGGFGLIGGTVSLGETPADALVRETMEEVGLTLNKKKLVLSHIQYKMTSINKKAGIVFFFTYPIQKGQVGVKEPHKFKDIVWLSAKDMPETLSLSLAKGIDCVLKGISYSEFQQ